MHLVLVQYDAFQLAYLLPLGTIRNVDSIILI